MYVCVGITQWLERRSRLTNFPCPAPTASWTSYLQFAITYLLTYSYSYSFVVKPSAINQLIWPTQPSIPARSVNE